MERVELVPAEAGSPSPTTERFFSALQPFTDPRDVCDPVHYAEVPSDWMVAITDVRGSTAAIEAGRYRDVNLVGAASITAALNATRGVELPYVFGGDGATLLFPASRTAAVRAALLSVQLHAEARFGLELRVGCVPVAELVAAGHPIRLARLRIGGVHLAMLAGSGPSQAEKWIKGSAKYLWQTEGAARPDLEGLECRWEPLAAKRGEILSVLIRARDPDEHQAAEVYRRAITEIGRLTGALDGLNPAQPANLHLSLDPRRLQGELALKAPAGETALARTLRLLGLWLHTALGALLVRFRLTLGGIDWGAYQDDVVRNTDFWKYDDTLRFVIDVSAEQKAALLACFQRFEAAGELVFGIHASTSALMTCLVFDRAGHHVHFVDGGDGGYALAAKQLKAKLASTSDPAPRGSPA